MRSIDMAGSRTFGGVRATGRAAGVALAVMSAGAWAGDARAEGAARTAELRQNENPDELPRLIAQLDSAEFMSRQEASAAIITDDRITIAMIEEALKDPLLSPEQRQRLRHVQRQRFEGTPRAAMGVQFASQLLPHRVALNMTIRPFKSADLLEPGDLIESADGISLRSPRAFETMRMIIISHDPGDELDLVIRRGEERLNIRVPLGQYSELRNQAPLDPMDLERAWRMRLGRTPDPTRETITTGLTMDEWSQMEEASRQRRAVRDANAARSGLMNVPPRILIAGGKPRPPFFDEGEFNKLLVIRDKDELRFEDVQLLRQQQLDQQRRFAAQQMTVMGPPMSLEDEIARVRDAAESVRAEAQRLRDQAQAGQPVDPALLEANAQSLLATERVLLALLAEQKEAAE